MGGFPSFTRNKSATRETIRTAVTDVLIDPDDGDRQVVPCDHTFPASNLILNLQALPRNLSMIWDMYTYALLGFLDHAQTYERLILKFDVYYQFDPGIVSFDVETQERSDLN